jgi:hypothetical protein
MRVKSRSPLSTDSASEYRASHNSYPMDLFADRAEPVEAQESIHISAGSMRTEDLDRRFLNDYMLVKSSVKGRVRLAREVVSNSSSGIRWLLQPSLRFRSEPPEEYPS